VQHRVFTGCLIAAGVVLGLPATRAVADGTAKASVTVDGQTFTFSGGSCVRSDGGLTVDIGVHTSPGQAGSPPDYFGVYLAKAPGSFDDGAVSFTKDGKRYSVGHATGEATTSGATFSGPLLRGGGMVKGSFTC
jgi:hypothetical protein